MVPLKIPFSLSAKFAQSLQKQKRPHLAGLAIENFTKIARSARRAGRPLTIFRGLGRASNENPDFGGVAIFGDLSVGFRRFET
jgi:hypothetical protein